MLREERGALVFGAAVQVDAYQNQLNPNFDHDWVTPGLFITGDRDFGSTTVSASIRGDLHPEAGLELTERLALLFRPGTEWSVRVGAGTGFAAPAPLTEEVEAIGLRAIQGFAAGGFGPAAFFASFVVAGPGGPRLPFIVTLLAFVLLLPGTSGPVISGFVEESAGWQALFVGGEGPVRGWAYDAVSDHWATMDVERSSPTPPLLAWTGRQLYVWGDRPPPDDDLHLFRWTPDG